MEYVDFATNNYWLQRNFLPRKVFYTLLQELKVTKLPISLGVYSTALDTAFNSSL